MNRNNFRLFGLFALFIFFGVAGVFLLNRFSINPFNDGSMVVSGYVVSGGDTTPKGLFDAPRKHVFVIRKDDQSLVNVTYTAYPPTAFDNTKTEGIRFSLYRGTIEVGDYFRAKGYYDQALNTVKVVGAGDYIETFKEK